MNRFTRDSDGQTRDRFKRTYFENFTDINARESGSYSTESPDEFKRLASIGRSLMLAATGDKKPSETLSSAESGVGDNQGFSGLSGIMKGAFGSLTFDDNAGSVPLGTDKINIANFNAKAHHLPDSDISVKSSNYTKESYGQLNSYMEDFQSKAMFEQSMAGMFAALGVSLQYWLIAEALLLATNGVNLLVGLLGVQNPNDAIFAGPAAPGVRLNKGQSRTRQKYAIPEFSTGGHPGILSAVGNRLANLLEDFLDYLEIRKPVNVMQAIAEGKGMGIAIILPYTQSIAYGWTTLMVGQLTDLGASSGYYASVLRSLMRGRVYLDTYSSSGDGADLINYFRKMKENKLMRFINILSSIGDIAVSAGFFGQYTFSENDVPIDFLPDTGLTRVAKNMDRTLERSIVRTSATPSMLLLPSSVQKAGFVMDAMGLENGLGGLYLEGNKEGNDFVRRYLDSDLGKGIKGGAAHTKLDRPMDPEANRFSQEEVKAMEDMLEAEYMPFYFHDLRTNEIISFHAFLTSLSDGFSANWSAQKGFGRIEAAQIYGDTSRAIAFNFRIQAMSPQDLEEMYYKINKLTTLVYPQFSRGTMVETTSNKFVIPFSQVPTASPLVRVRIGDLLRSNYSDQSLGRMMGTGDANFEYDGQGLGGMNGEIQAGLIDAQVQQLKASLSDNSSALPLFTYATFQANRGDRTLNGADLGHMKFTQKLRGYSIITNQGTGRMSTDMASNFSGIKSSDLKDTEVWMLVLDPAEGEPMAVKVKKGQITQIDMEKTVNAFTDLFVPSFGETSVSSLFDTSADKGNPIIRSFRSSGGRGLAGAITGLSLDWKLNSVLWETTPGKRGPQACEISVTFTPIHDITPGMDSDGFNRAPIYGIGDINRQIQGDPWGTTQEYEDSLKQVNSENDKIFLKPKPKVGIPGIG